MATVIGVLAAAEESPNLANEDREHISETICYLAERLAALQHVADKSATINVADLIPRESTRGRRGPSRTLLFDVARGMAHRIPLTKLIQLDADIRPYLASLMVAAMAKAGDRLAYPQGMALQPMTQAAFDNMIIEDVAKVYDNYGLIGSQLGDRFGSAATSEEITRAHQKRLED